MGNDYDTRNKSGRWRIREVYNDEQVKSFWSNTDESTNRAIQTSIQPALSDGEFKKRVSKTLSKKEKKYLEGCTHAKLDELMQVCLHDAKVQQENHDSSMHWGRRLYRGTEGFMNDLHSYVEAYSGFARLMNGAGQGYGDAAYAAISLLLVVAVNKKRTQDLFDMTISKLERQYARTKMLKDIYPSKKLKEDMAVVHRLGIELLRQATLYYAVGTWRRIWRIISNPPAVALEAKVAEIEHAIDEMMQEMQTCDRIRLHDIEVAVRNVSKTLEGVEKKVEVMHIRSDTVCLRTLKEHLKIGDQQLKAALQAYEDLLNTRFGKIRKLPQFNVNSLLLDHEQFRSWRNSSRSSVLILKGRTVLPRPTYLNWLSPAVVYLIQNAERHLLDGPNSRSSAMISYCCQTEDGDGASEKISLVTVISNLIYQLLQTDQALQLLRDNGRYQTLERNIIDAFGPEPSQNRREQARQLYTIFKDLLDTLSFQNVYLLIDRMDRIEGTLGFERSVFLDLLEKRPGKKHGVIVKIFIVAPDLTIDMIAQGISESSHTHIIECDQDGKR